MSAFPDIPGYRIEKELGEGGMATVYLGHDDKLDRPVAIKVMELLTTQGKDLAVRFIKEARTVAKLQHANIVPIHDVGNSGNLYYMVVEYFPGGTLKEKISRNPGGMAVSEALVLLRQISRALEYAHSEGFIHRDIKPDNIMFRKDGTPVLVDFGIARAVGSTTKLTKTGMSIGTPHYMSPEQSRGKPLDGRSDIYSLGIVLYEMLTGKVPYEAEDSDSIAIAIKHIQEPIPTLPENLKEYQPIINKMMAKNPEDRLQTGREVIELINNSVSGTDIKPEPVDLGQSRIPIEKASEVAKKTSFKYTQDSRKSSRRRLILWLSLLLVVLVGTFLTVLFTSNRLGEHSRLHSNDKMLSRSEVKSMLQRHGFYDSSWHKSKTFRNQFNKKYINGDAVVVDKTTGLMWQQGGASKRMKYKDIKEWIKNLNRQGYAGYHDWRLPTLEEGASLIKSSKGDGDLYVDPVFSKLQKWIWTSDFSSSSSTWVVFFQDGGVYDRYSYYFYYVRAVRSIK